jgi:hypothetical protein
MVLLLLVFERMQIKKTDVQVGYQTGDRPSSWGLLLYRTQSQFLVQVQPNRLPSLMTSKLHYVLRVLPISQHKVSKFQNKLQVKELTLSPTSISIVA